MAVGHPVIERWRFDRFFFYISMGVGYPVIDRWIVDRCFLYQYGCWMFSDREMQSLSVFFYICMAVG